MRPVKTLLVLTVVAVLASGAMAQDSQKKRQGKGKGKGVQLHPLTQAMMRHEMMIAATKKLELNEEQKGKLEELHKSIQPEMESMFKKVSEVLGEEKVKELSEVAKKAKEAGKSPRQVAVAVDAVMKLTEEQSKKLTTVAEEVTKAQRGMTRKLNAMLTDEQKEAFKAAMSPQRRGGKNKEK